jgi:hypothetical protein
MKEPFRIPFAIHRSHHTYLRHYVSKEVDTEHKRHDCLTADTTL